MTIASSRTSASRRPWLRRRGIRDRLCVARGWLVGSFWSTKPIRHGIARDGFHQRLVHRQRELEAPARVLRVAQKHSERPGARMIAATTWSWPSVVDALHPYVLIAAGRARPQPQLLRGRVPITIGIGTEFVAGDHVDIVVAAPSDPPRADSPCEAPCREHTTPTQTRRSYVVASTRFGRFATVRRIGDAVRAGEPVGAVGNQTIAAPATGVLLGLAARGARIQPGDELVEIDPAECLTLPRHC
jgi:biotin carboxyl carrier protein